MPIVSSLPGVFDSLGGQSTHDGSSTFVKVDAVPFERTCCVALAFCIAKKLNIAPCEPQVSASKPAPCWQVCSRARYTIASHPRG